MTSLGETDWQCPLNCVPFVKYLFLERRALLSITKEQGLQTQSRKGTGSSAGTRVDPQASWEVGGRRGLSADREGTIHRYCSPPALSEEGSIENISPEVGQRSLPEGLSILMWLSSPAPVSFLLSSCGEPQSFPNIGL